MMLSRSLTDALKVGGRCEAVKSAPCWSPDERIRLVKRIEEPWSSLDALEAFIERCEATIEKRGAA